MRNIDQCGVPLTSFQLFFLILLNSSQLWQLDSSADGAQGEHRCWWSSTGFHSSWGADVQVISKGKRTSSFSPSSAAFMGPFPTKQRLDPDSLCCLLDTTPLVPVAPGDEERVWGQSLCSFAARAPFPDSHVLLHLQKLNKEQSDIDGYWLKATVSTTASSCPRSASEQLSWLDKRWEGWRETSLPQPTHSYFPMTAIASSQLHAQFGII